MLYKHEDLVQSSKTHLKKPGVEGAPVQSIIGLRLQRQKAPVWLNVA